MKLILPHHLSFIISPMSLSLCFREAWRGFKAWWLPLCLLAAIVVVMSHSWLISHLLRDELNALKPCTDVITHWHAKLAAGHVTPHTALLATLDELSKLNHRPEIQAAWRKLLLSAAWLLGGISVLLSALHVTMVIISKASVQTHPDAVTLRRDLPRTALFTLSYIVLAVMKMLPIICCCFLPGLYIYLRLYFTDFLITERSPNPFAAAAQSWRLTRGHLLPLAVLFTVTLATHLLSLLTYGLAEIPFRPFEYTLRAAAYRQLRSNLVPSPPHSP
ncbi:MAG: hypothetical protein N2595_02730 [bacterium]|nr:hypothetical protein [bacterium]